MTVFKREKHVWLDLFVKDIPAIYSQTKSTTRVSVIYGDINNGKELINQLIDGGFSLNKETFIIWEGGTFYLEPQKVVAILGELTKNMNVVGCTLDCLNRAVFENEQHKNHNMIQSVLSILEKSENAWLVFLDIKEVTSFFMKELEFKYCSVTLH